jgi:hypothetical protein
LNQFESFLQNSQKKNKKGKRKKKKRKKGMRQHFGLDPLIQPTAQLRFFPKGYTLALPRR